MPMFEKITNKKKVEELQSQLKKLQQDNADLLKDLDNIKLSNDKDSSIIFVIDENLKVTTTTSINKAIRSKLVDYNYVDIQDMNNDKAIHLAFIMIANEATSQIMDDFVGEPIKEDDEDDTKSNR
jgi:hypothetical protein